jgi:23S rRNA-/tRNA-specific pseudouridylate synthase
MWEFIATTPDRLDRSLRNQVFPGHEWLSRAAWDALFSEGRVTVNGRRVGKPGAPLAVGDLVRVFFPGPLGLQKEAPARALWLADDRSWGVFDKPVGIATVPLLPWETETFAARVAGFAADLGLEFSSLSAPPALEGGLVQRLDRDTSGVLMSAFTGEAKARLRDQLGTGRIEKTYLALVERAPPEGEHVLFFPESHGVRVKVSSARPKEEAEEARVTVEIYKKSSEGALVLVRTCQGRRHVVRASLQALGSPLVGDAAYGGSPRTPHHQLHALSLRVPGVAASLEAPPPESFLVTASELGVSYSG